VLVQLTCGLRRLVMSWLVLALAVALVGLGAPAATAAAAFPTASGVVGRLVTLQGVSCAGFDGHHQATEDQGWQHHGSTRRNFGSERSG